MRKIARFSLILLMAIAACGESTQTASTTLNEFQWLLGIWETSVRNETVYEAWTKVSDTRFEGKSYKDSTVLETIVINIEKNGDIYYTATVLGQNNDQPVKFKLVSHKDQTIAFENKKHDFPRKITYKKESDTSIQAILEGTLNGKKQTAAFNLRKQ